MENRFLPQNSNGHFWESSHAILVSSPSCKSNIHVCSFPIPNLMRNLMRSLLWLVHNQNFTYASGLHSVFYWNWLLRYYAMNNYTSKRMVSKPLHNHSLVMWGWDRSSQLSSKPLHIKVFTNFPCYTRCFMFDDYRAGFALSPLSVVIYFPSPARLSGQLYSINWKTQIRD